MDNNLLLTVGTQLLPLYEKYFLVKLDGYRFTNDRSFSRAPITFKSKKHIILNCDPDCDCQIAFQLSHELCHAAIPESVPNNLRWLEETFAVMASYIFPRQIPVIDTIRYDSYFQRFSDSLKPLCIKTPNVPTPETLSILETGSGTSNFNDYGSYWMIAQALLSSVKQCPAIWCAIPLLCEIPEHLSFTDSMEFWKNIAPSDISDVISVIVSAF